MNSRDLFYVRYLQLRIINVKREELYALFILEKELFKYFPKTDEKILSKIKLKWLFEEISKKNKNNYILKNFKGLDFQYNNIKKLIMTYDKIINSELDNTFITKFKKFNKIFNTFIKEFKSTFCTSYIFQIIYMVYDNELVISKTTYNKLIDEFNNNYKNIRRAERVFIDLFFDIYPQKKKITKRSYLFHILKSYF